MAPVKRDLVESAGSWAVVVSFLALVGMAMALELQDKAMHDNGIMMMLLGFIISELRSLTVHRGDKNGSGIPGPK